MNTFAPEHEVSENLEELFSALSARQLREAPRLIANDGPPMELSPQVAEILKLIVTELHSGRAVSVIAHEAKMTTQQAADHLGMSRPTLIKMLEKYSVPVETIGRHRRIAFKDLQVLNSKIKSDQMAKLERLAEIARVTGELENPDFHNPLIRS